MTHGDTPDSLNGKQLGLRPEARFFSFEQLHATQLATARRLLDLLKVALTDAQTADDDKRELKPRWLDAHRNSRVAFLSGPRGSGKTSVLLSLISESQGSQRRSDRETPGGEKATLLKELRAKLRECGQQIVWLEPIDLDPLPEATSFLAAVLARLVRAVRARQEDAPNHGAMSRSRDAWLEVERLQRDVTIAWDSNLAARRASLDPDSYVAEVVRTEEVRLGIHGRLTKAIRHLRSPSWGREPQLFVLVIDDFDLEPAHAVEILRILRTLSIPGLFTILLGDLNVAEDMFETKTEGRIQDLARSSFRSGRRSEQLVHTSPAEIASNAVRKMVPPSQRIRLDPWHPRDAADYRPDEDSPRLRDIAGRIELRIPEGIVRGKGATPDATPTFGDFLFVDSVRSTKEEVRLAYDGSELVLAPPRHIMDFWCVLRDVLVHPTPTGRDDESAAGSEKRMREQTRRLIHTLVAELRSAVAEDPALSRRDRRRVLSCVQFDPLRREWEVTTTPLSLRSSLTEGIVLELNKGGTTTGGSETTTGGSKTTTDQPPRITPATTTEASPPGPPGAAPNTPEAAVTRVPIDIPSVGWEATPHRVRARRFRRWLFRTARTGTTRAGTTRAGTARDAEPLGHRTAAALMVIRDIVALTGAGIVENALVDEMMKDRGFTEWEIGARDPIRVPWAVDIWGTFWAYGRFADGWNLAKKRAKQIREAPSNLEDRGIVLFLAYGWIAAGLSVLRNPSVHLLSWANVEPDQPAGAANGTPATGVYSMRSHASIQRIDVEPKDWRWNDLVHHLKELVNDLGNRVKNTASDIRLDEMRAWFIGLACLLAPEVGIPEHIFRLLAVPTDGNAGEFWASEVGRKLDGVWRRTDTGRNVAKCRAVRLGIHLLSPLGLAMVNPKLAAGLTKPNLPPYDTQQGLVDKAWNEVNGEAKKQAKLFGTHPINAAHAKLNLCPEVGMILDVLHGLPLREGKLTREERLLYHSLLGTPGAQSSRTPIRRSAASRRSTGSVQTPAAANAPSVAEQAALSAPAPTKRPRS